MHGKIPYQGMLFKDFVELVGYTNSHHLQIDNRANCKGLTQLMKRCLNRNDELRPQFEHIIETLKQLQNPPMPSPDRPLHTRSKDRP